MGTVWNFTLAQSKNYWKYGLVGFEASVRVPILWDFMYRIMDTVIDNDYVLQIIDYDHLVNFIESKIWFIMSLYALGDKLL